MTTSLSIDSISASLHENSTNPHHSAIQNQDMHSSFSLKKGAPQQSNDGFSNGSQSHSNSHTHNGSPQNSYSASVSSTKKRGDSQSNAQQQQQAQINLANSLLTFQYPYLPYNQYPAPQSQSYYSSGTGVGQQALPQSASNNAAASGNNRRSGKKKAQASSNAQSEQRVYFNLKKRDQPVCHGKGGSGTGSGGGHHNQIYKPKIPPSMTEWFVKLSADERVNALTTISQHSVDTFISMHQKQEMNGKKYTFADMNNQNEKQSQQQQQQQQQQQYPCSYSQYSQYVASIFQASSYESLNNNQEQGYLRNEGGGRPESYQRSQSQANNSFDESYYCKERTEMEIKTITQNDKDREKIYSEEEILKYVRIFDFNQYLDTLSVSQQIVQDPDQFLKLMSNATSGKAFQQPCLFKFDTNTQENTIDDPSWFKKRGFYSLSECVIAILEQNLWAHYNYENNQNLGNSKVNDLPALFKDRGESDFSEVSCETLAKFWHSCSADQKNALLEKLKDNSKALVKQANSNTRGKAKNSSCQSKQGSLRSNDYQASFSISDRQYRGNDQDSHDQPYNNISSEEQQLIYEIKDIIELANKVGREMEMIESLQYSPLNRAGKRFDKLSRAFLQLLRVKYQEDLVEMLLQEEQKSKSNTKWAHNNGKRKKKKNLQQPASGNPDKDPAAASQDLSTITATTTLPQDESVKSNKKKKQKKQMFSAQMPADSKLPQSAEQLAPPHLKKKKGAGSSQSKLTNPQQSEYNKSFDDSLSRKPAIDDHAGDYERDETTTQQYSGCTNSYENTLKTQTMDEINSSLDTDQLALSTSNSVGGPDSKADSKKHLNPDQPTLKKNNGSHMISQANNKSLNMSISNHFPQSEDETLQNIYNSPQRQFSEQEENQINEYVKELAKDMVDKVCKMNEEDNKQQAIKAADDIQSKGNSDYRNLAANSEDTGKHISHDSAPASKCSFKKKGQPPSYQPEGNPTTVDECTARKASFNKKYSEDYYQKRSNNNKKQSFKNNYHDPDQQQTPDTAKPTHKNSNISLASESSNSQINPDKRQTQPAYWNRNNNNNNNDSQQTKKHSANQSQSDSMNKKPKDSNDSKMQTQNNMNNMNKMEENGGKKNKRKRNKGKMNDQDIMNNFVKNLQSNSEDTSTTENEAKSDKNSLAGNKNNAPTTAPIKNVQPKKNSFHHNNTHTQPATSKVTVMSTTTTTTTTEETKNKQAPSSSQSAQYKQKSNATILHKHQSQVYSNSPIVTIQKTEQSLQQKHSSLSQQQVNTPTPTTAKPSAQKQQKHQQQPQQYRPRATFSAFHKSSEQEKEQDMVSRGDRESFDSLSNQDSKSDKQIAQPQPIQTQKPPKKSVNQPQSFKSLNFKTTYDWETDSSHNDNPATVIPITMEANHVPIIMNSTALLPPQQDELIFYPQQQNPSSSSLQVTIDSTIKQCDPQIFSPQIIPSSLHFNHTQSQSQSYSQTYPYASSLQVDDLQIPPTIQSPYSCLSTQAQCFTPKDYNMTNQQQYYQNSYIPQNNNNQFHLDTRGGYQSFQGTPVKSQKVGYRNTTAQINNETNANNANGYQQQQPFYPQKQHAPTIQQQYQQQEQSNANYMTPPHTAKKQANYYSQGGIGLSQAGEFRKPLKTDVTAKPIQSIQKSPQMQYQSQRQSSQEDDLQQQRNIVHKQMSVPASFLNHQNNSNSLHQDQIFDYYENEQMRMNPNQTHYPPQQDNMYMYHQQQSPNPTNRYVDPNQNLLYQFINSLTVQQPMMNGGSPHGPMNNNNYTQNTHFMPNQDYHHANEAFNQPAGIQVDNNEYLEAETQFYKKLDSDIYEFVGQIKRNLDLLQPERQQVLNQIKQTAQEVYLNQAPRVIVFGSLTTGLALESSDMDLAITDLKIEDRYVMISEMQKLAAVIESWECLDSFKFIDTASIPVIKIKVNLNKMREMNMAGTVDTETMKSDFQARPIRKDQSLLSVDITFDDSTQSPHAPTMQQPHIALTHQDSAPLSIGSCTGSFAQLSQPASPIFQSNKTHLGLESCYLVQNYIATYPNLKEVAILLKKYLAVHDLNSPYYGGISSYSTVLLIVAYMNYFKRQALEALSPSQLLMGFLDFYGNFFNPSTWGISVINEGSYFQQMGTMTLADSNFMILDPLNLQNNTSRNSYLTSQILRQFQCAFNNLKSLILKNLNLAKSNSALNTTTSTTIGFSIPAGNDTVDTVFQSSNYQQQPDQISTTDSNHSKIINTSSPLRTDANAFHMHTTPSKSQSQYQSTELNMGTLQAQSQMQMNSSNSITLSDAITNIEVIKRGNFERFLTNISKNTMLDLGEGISSDLHTSVQQQQLIQNEQRRYESPHLQNNNNNNNSSSNINNHVSPLTQQQQTFFANINLLETFFSKDSDEAAGKGDVNLSVQSENKTTNVSVLTNNRAGDGSKTVKE